MTMDELNDLFDDGLQLDLEDSPKQTPVDTNTDDDLFLSESIEKEITGNPVLDNLLKARGITDGKIKIIDKDCIKLIKLKIKSVNYNPSIRIYSP